MNPSLSRVSTVDKFCRNASIDIGCKFRSSVALVAYMLAVASNTRSFSRHCWSWRLNPVFGATAGRPARITAMASSRSSP